MNKLINKMMKTLMTVALALVTIVGVGATKASAQEQGHWEQNRYGKWFYYYADGTYAMDTIIDGKYKVAWTGVWDGITLNDTTQAIQNNTATQTVQANNIAQAVSNSNNSTISYAEFTKIADDKMLELINAHRIANGVGTLEWDQILANTATEKDEHMINHNYVSHSYKNTATVDVQEVDWRHNIDSENCLSTSQTFALTKEDANTLGIVMFNQWKASPLHNQNMLNPEWKKFGFGFAFSNGKAQYTAYGTQHFAGQHNGYDDHLILGPNVPHSLKDFN